MTVNKTRIILCVASAACFSMFCCILISVFLIESVKMN